MIEEGRKAKSPTAARMLEEGSRPPEFKTPEWDALVKIIEDELGRKICGAPRRNRLKVEVRGFPCERKPLKGRHRCQFHGGKARPGPEHHAIKHGRYSKALGGTSIADMYRKAVQDPDLLNLTEEIGLLAARLQQTLMRLNRGDDGGGKEIWIIATKQITRAKRHLKKLDVDGRDYESLVSIFENLDDVFQHGLNDYRVWDDWFNGVEQLRKLVDTERKHREAQGLNMSVERAMLMLTIWSQAAANVLGAEQAALLRQEIARLRESTADQNLMIGSGRDISKVMG